MINKLQQISRKVTHYPVGLYLGLTNKRYGRSHRITESKTYQWINTIAANFVAEKIRKSELTDGVTILELTVLETNGKFKSTDKRYNRD